MRMRCLLYLQYNIKLIHKLSELLVREVCGY